MRFLSLFAFMFAATLAVPPPLSAQHPPGPTDGELVTGQVLPPTILSATPHNYGPGVMKIFDNTFINSGPHYYSFTKDEPAVIDMKFDGEVRIDRVYYRHWRITNHRLDSFALYVSDSPEFDTSAPPAHTFTLRPGINDDGYHLRIDPPITSNYVRFVATGFDSSHNDIRISNLIFFGTQTGVEAPPDPTSFLPESPPRRPQEQAGTAPPPAGPAMQDRRVDWVLYSPIGAQQAIDSKGKALIYVRSEEFEGSRPFERSYLLHTDVTPILAGKSTFFIDVTRPLGGSHAQALGAYRVPTLVYMEKGKDPELLVITGTTRPSAIYEFLRKME